MQFESSHPEYRWLKDEDISRFCRSYVSRSFRPCRYAWNSACEIIRQSKNRARRFQESLNFSALFKAAPRNGRSFDRSLFLYLSSGRIFQLSKYISSYYFRILAPSRWDSLLTALSTFFLLSLSFPVARACAWFHLGRRKCNQMRSARKSTRLSRFARWTSERASYPPRITRGFSFIHWNWIPLRAGKANFGREQQ